MAVEVIPVTTKSDQKLFLNLPWKFHAGNANWIPPLRKNQKELCGFAPHPFYNNADAQAFLAKRDNRPVGRILAVTDHGYNAYNKSNLGYFGFFESENDPEVAKGLFNAVKQYHANEGRDVVRGPLNPSMNYECGLLVDGFDSPPVFMMTYNPEFYSDLIEANGFQKVHDLYAYLGKYGMLETNKKRWDFIQKKLGDKINFSMRAMSRPKFDEELRGFLDVYNKALVGSWGFSPITNEEMDHMADGLRHLIAPEMTAVVEVDGQRVGVGFAMLDYNPRIKQIDGKLFPFGFLKLLMNKKKIKRIRMISANVLPEFQKNKGIGLSVFCSMIPAIQEWGIEECEFSWVLESNQFSRATLERCGTELYKTYRIYDCPLK